MLKKLGYFVIAVIIIAGILYFVRGSINAEDNDARGEEKSSEQLAH